MNYRCPNCKNRLNMRTLFFKDISACANCGQKVVLGDSVAFLVAALSLFITGMTLLWRLSHVIDDPFISAGYALGGGIVVSIVVLVLLGRATAYKPLRFRATTGRAPLTDSEGKAA